jgi:hypothetical protein
MNPKSGLDSLVRPIVIFKGRRNCRDLVDFVDETGSDQWNKESKSTTISETINLYSLRICVS